MDEFQQPARSQRHLTGLELKLLHGECAGLVQQSLGITDISRRRQLV